MKECDRVLGHYGFLIELELDLVRRETEPIHFHAKVGATLSDREKSAGIVGMSLEFTIIQEEMVSAAAAQPE